VKRVEIILPHRLLADVHAILKEVNVRGMSHYRIEGSGRVKAQPVKIEVVVKD
jgi:nitrogen regulatory protein PII